MKNQSVNNTAKTIFLGAILSVATLLATTAKAASISGNPASVDSVSTKAEIRYVGLDADELLSFTVKYNNPSGRRFNLLVLDESGESLFNGVYNDKKFNKAFKLPAASVNNLTFMIQGVKENYKEVFNIDVNTRQITDVVVSKN